MAEVFLRLETVRSRTGLSRSMLYALVERGNFPRQISLGARAVAWAESEVDAWIKARIDAARNPVTTGGLECQSHSEKNAMKAMQPKQVRDECDVHKTF